MKNPKNLTPEQYNVCFAKGTEPPFSGKYYKHKEKGDYICVVCGQRLFSSVTKFDSGSGWPSFWDAVNKDSVALEEDFSHGMQRIEVSCGQCGAHLGHVFDDGPVDSAGTPGATGKRYCINSLALDFKAGAK